MFSTFNQNWLISYSFICLNSHVFLPFGFWFLPRYTNEIIFYIWIACRPIFVVHTFSYVLDLNILSFLLLFWISSIPVLFLCNLHYLLPVVHTVLHIEIRILWWTQSIFVSCVSLCTGSSHCTKSTFSKPIGLLQIFFMIYRSKW